MISTCKIIGHKWRYYKDDVDMNFVSFVYNRQCDFRICVRCSHKEIRNHHTGIDSQDWEKYELSKEELRNKKLKELGIE